MAKKITVFSLTLLIFLLAFSFVSVHIVRKYDVSSVRTKGFSRPTDAQIYNSSIERVRTTKGYKDDVIPEYPLVISSLTDSYTHFVAPVEDIVLVPDNGETSVVEQPIRVPQTPQSPTVSVILPDVSVAPSTPPEPSEPVNVQPEPSEVVPTTPVVPAKPKRETLSNSKAETRLEDILNAYEESEKPGEVLSSLDTDTTSATLTEKDKTIARKALRDAALEKVNAVLNSDEAKNFVWYDPLSAPNNVMEDIGIN